MITVNLLLHALFTFALAYYFASALQWYSYRLNRVVFHFHRYDWHLYWFLIPWIAQHLLNTPWVFMVYLLYPFALALWAKRLDKALVFTARIKRFFLFLSFFLLLQVLFVLRMEDSFAFSTLIPIVMAHLVSVTFEAILFRGFYTQAQKKLSLMKELKVIAITASYGKTSIKNFLAQILATRFHVYATPRSVNTLGGIVKDINEELPQACDVYIVEAGAREKGDIDAIAHFVNPHVAIVGSIGEQHIEYFKTLENIRNTKMELLHSNRLQKAFVHCSAQVNPTPNIHIFGEDIFNISSTLEGISFELNLGKERVLFTCKLLGAFNTINLAAAIHVAYYLNVPIETIQKAVASMKGVSHRLEKIEAGGKLIIDDSFNGNLEGMLSSYALVSSYCGRKVIITPGIIESTEEANIRLAQTIDALFDLVIITSNANAKILDTYITRPEKIILPHKRDLQTILAQKTFAGDLILFSNDAPSFI